MEHVLELEQTELRAVFLEEMERVQPECVRTHSDKASVLKKDFYEAVLRCDDEFRRQRVRTWVDQVERMSDEEIQAPGGGYEPLDEELMM